MNADARACMTYSSVQTSSFYFVFVNLLFDDPGLQIFIHLTYLVSLVRQHQPSMHVFYFGSETEESVGSFCLFCNKITEICMCSHRSHVVVTGVFHY